MQSRNKAIIFWAISWLCLTMVGSISAVTIPDRPDQYVVDLAGIIDDPTKTKLNGYLQELEQKTSAQFVVLTIKSLEGETIESFALNVAHDRWRLGQKGKDNGLLLLVAVDDRKYRIEVGYGLEGILPDSLVGSIGREYLVAYFRRGDYSEGVFRSALALSTEIAKAAGVTITGMPELQVTRPRSKPGNSIGGIVFLVFLIIVLIAWRRDSKGILPAVPYSSRNESNSPWGGTGGFGGFGGGGGGGFGGGGASGSW